MIPAPTQITRRRVMTGLAALAALQPIGRAAAVGAFAATLKDGPGRPAFDLTSITLPAPLRADDPVRLNVTSNLAAPVTLGARGLDGVQKLQPLLNSVVEPGQSVALELPFSTAGTFAIEATLLGDDPAQGKATMPVVVAEPAPPQTDQDRIVLIEDVPGGYTANGQANIDLRVRVNERLRLRLFNGCRRNAVALQFEDHDVRVIAIDSRPAEPFLARERRVILAPGTRVDVLIDATQPAGTTSAVQLFDGTGPKRIGQFVYATDAPLRAQPLLPAAPLADVPIKLELASALRVPVDLAAVDWSFAKDMLDKRPAPLFRVKQGRTVLLTLSNRATLPTTLQLHGHHFRWLDRLDDGWKPFLLDTMIVDVGLTERIAFRADFAGDWLIESIAMNATAPRRVQWFSVDQR